MSVRLKLGRMDMLMPQGHTPDSYIEVAAGMVQAQRHTDESSWADVLVIADEAAQHVGTVNRENWEREPDAYWGVCTKECHGPAVLMKGSIREFGCYGVYVCGTCEYAYPPGSAPSPIRGRA